MKTEFDVSELGISKNLLQMNFMKRTLVAQEKNITSNPSDLLPNPDEYSFELPLKIQKHFTRLTLLLQNRPKIKHNKSLFDIYHVPAGFRQSYGGFNTTQTAKNVENRDTTESTNPAHDFFGDRDDSQSYPQSEPRAQEGRKRGVRKSFQHMNDGPKKAKRRKTSHM